MPRSATASRRRRGRPSTRTTLRDDGIVLLQRQRRKPGKTASKKTGWSFEWRDLDDFVAYPDASVLMAYVSEALLEHHVNAIRSGRDPKTGAQLPALDPDGLSGRRARAGKRPDHRGFARLDGRDLASLLSRSKVRARNFVKVGKGRIGGAASASIGAGTGGHGSYLVKAATEDGVEHLAIEGLAQDVIDEAVEFWLEEMLRGGPSDLPEFGRLQGRDL